MLCFFFSSRRRHTRCLSDWQTCALPIFRLFQLDEADLRTALVHPHVMIGSDGSSLAPYGPLGEGKPHARSYGPFQIGRAPCRHRGVVMGRGAAPYRRVWDEARGTTT